MVSAVVCADPECAPDIICEGFVASDDDIYEGVNYTKNYFNMTIEQQLKLKQDNRRKTHKKKANSKPKCSRKKKACKKDQIKIKKSKRKFKSKPKIKRAVSQPQSLSILSKMFS